MKLFVTCPKGVEPLLKAELESLGALDVRETLAGVRASATLEVAYRICLWSRLANRVLMQLAHEPIGNADDLYQVVQSVNWLDHLRSQGTLAVDFSGRMASINNTHFGAQKVKDAIVDQIREQTRNRPSVDRAAPDLRVNVHIGKGHADVYIDLSGDSLHRRGYRLKAGQAPMKENLAAAVLTRAGWPAAGADKPCLLDPMCGSGTLVIEAVLMAADVAPGLLRKRFGFNFWLQHDRQIWQALIDEAEQRREQGLAQLSMEFLGSDLDGAVLERAKENAERAGVADFIRWQHADVSTLQVPAEQGVLISNPPYAERMGDASQLMFMYRELGAKLKRDFGGWDVAVFSGNPDQCKVMGLKADKSYKFFNGALECRLFLYRVHNKATEVAGTALPEQGSAPAQPAMQLSDQAAMFANRLRKNQRNLKRWIKKESIECYRIYDADIPEYAVAVDVYGDWVQVQEYAPPKQVDPVKAFTRLQDVMQLVPEILGVKADKVVLKQRQRQQGKNQYEKRAETSHFFPVIEHGCRLRVNLHDYLDTGLFLDHRPVRKRLQAMSGGKDVLNLFCYTGTASVHMAVGGAATTTSVDLSATYLAWAMKNMGLNGFSDSAHRFIQSDCLRWLKEQRQPAYDLIFMDPPTFSNSKRMDGVLDVQRDHVELVRGAMKLLRPGGTLVFSNNYRRFALDYEALSEFEVKDISRQTLDPDFARNDKIHVCFEIRHR